ncbi:hypothetical protein JCM24511_01840 [Saitozyma sp. JCM 24511]|nr:hypothetical protein JCM24511_01840 [Saitozyma sp. JCM 24511]
MRFTVALPLAALLTTIVASPLVPRGGCSDSNSVHECQQYNFGCDSSCQCTCSWASPGQVCTEPPKYRQCWGNGQSCDGEGNCNNWCQPKFQYCCNQKEGCVESDGQCWKPDHSGIIEITLEELAEAEGAVLELVGDVVGAVVNIL